MREVTGQIPKKTVQEYAEKEKIVVISLKISGVDTIYPSTLGRAGAGNECNGKARGVDESLKGNGPEPGPEGRLVHGEMEHENA